MKIWKVLLAALILAVLALFRPGALDISATSDKLSDVVAQTPKERGAIAFALGDWDALSSATLETSAAPWRIVNAAMALQETDGDPTLAATVDLSQLYQSFGFLSPDQLMNWPDGLPQPQFDTPLGQNVGLASGTWPPIAVTIGNMGCAACHASVMYDETGAPDVNRVWLGTPNGSINLEAYTQTLFSALRDQTDDADALFTVIRSQDDTVTQRELLTLRYAILPRVKAAIEDRADFGQLLPHRASLPGATNGLDSLRLRLGLQDPFSRVEQSTFNSVPDLGGRLWRRKLLNTGSYAHPNGDHSAPVELSDLTSDHFDQHAGIIAYFTVPSMGVSDEVALSNIPDARDIVSWMSAYEPQPFPGEINQSLALEGAAIYTNACASCHGTLNSDGKLIRFPNWEGDVGTDPERAKGLKADVVDAVNASQFGQYITARQVTGYTAPPLVGLWSSAPYLHNGSVPTLWHLMRAEQRPTEFELGGHRLDLQKVGIDLAPPADYQPWSIPEKIDTTQFGLSNSGHTIGFETLSESEKVALLEFLKTL